MIYWHANIDTHTRAWMSITEHTALFCPICSLFFNENTHPNARTHIWFLRAPFIRNKVNWYLIFVEFKFWQFQAFIPGWRTWFAQEWNGFGTVCGTSWISKNRKTNKQILIVHNYKHLVIARSLCCFRAFKHGLIRQCLIDYWLLIDQT